VIDQRADLSAGVGPGQRLFHNRHGQRAPLQAERASDYAARLPDGQALPPGLNLVMLIQVPLVQHQPRGAVLPAASAWADGAASARCQKGMEEAVISSGPVEGPFHGLGGHRVVRDQRFPIRVTVQFYQATDSGVLTAEDGSRLAASIERVYLDADHVGSLVTRGWTGRPTEPVLPPTPLPASPAPSWTTSAWALPVLEGWARQPGRSVDDGVVALARRFGAAWSPADARELRNALALLDDGTPPQYP
jgi:hypothetical protein